MPQRAGPETSRVKERPWFHSSLGATLTPAGRELLEKYSNIPPGEVENHIYKAREFAWDIFPWPCVGEFWFVHFGLSQHPQYSALLTRLTSPTNLSPPRLLDLGTCLGQDLRKLAFDGVPVEQLYGSDLFSDFEQAGTMLFRDEENFAGRFVTADLLVEDADDFMGKLAKTEGTWDVLSAFMFLHIWNYKTQVVACKRVVKLLKPEKGSLLIGASTGSVDPGEQWLKPPLVPKERSVFRHSKETFVQMWGKIEEDLGVKVKVECTYDDEGERAARNEEEEAKGKGHFFKGTDQRRFYFSVELM